MNPLVYVAVGIVHPDEQTRPDIAKNPHKRHVSNKTHLIYRRYQRDATRTIKGRKGNF